MNESYDDDAPYWGGGERPTGQLRRVGRDVTSQLTRIVHEHQERHHFERTRQHRAVRVHTSRPAGQPYDRDLDDGRGVAAAAIAASAHEDPWDDGWDDDGWDDVDVWVAPEHAPVRHAVRRPRDGAGVDPRLLRLGAVAAAAVVVLPIAIALASGGDDQGQLASESATSAVAAQEGVTATTSTVPATTALIPITAAAVADPDDGSGEVDTGAAASGDSSGAGAAGVAAVRAASQPVCAGQYTVVPGDYWVRFADVTDASVDEWLAANDATFETSLFPGDELCIPEGATAPPPPATTAPPTAAPPATEAPPTAAPADPPATTAPPATEAPRVTDPPTTAAPTTAPPTTAPRTMSPPTTAPRPTTPPPAPSDVEGIIRSIFPDDEEDYAITIARRESGLDPSAYNGWCCYGLFQIYYRVHAGWLDDLGIDSAQDLLDARKNTLAAYTIWQRSGWSPWSTHG